MRLCYILYRLNALYLPVLYCQGVGVADGGLHVDALAVVAALARSSRLLPVLRVQLSNRGPQTPAVP